MSIRGRSGTFRNAQAPKHYTPDGRDDPASQIRALLIAQVRRFFPPSDAADRRTPEGLKRIKRAQLIARDKYLQFLAKFDVRCGQFARYDKSAHTWIYMQYVEDASFMWQQQLISEDYHLNEVRKFMKNEAKATVMIMSTFAIAPDASHCHLVALEKDGDDYRIIVKEPLMCGLQTDNPFVAKVAQYFSVPNRRIRVDFGNQLYHGDCIMRTSVTAFTSMLKNKLVSPAHALPQK